MGNELIFAVIGGFVLQAAVLYLIIASATRAEKRSRYDWAQTQFLAHIAKRNGMNEDEVNNIMNYL